MAEDNGRISVSKDFLRAELTGLELRIVEKLATKAEVGNLSDRVDTLETDVDRLKTWRKSLAGTCAVALAIALAALPDVIHRYVG